MPSRTYTFDAALELARASYNLPLVVTASGAAQVDAANKILDLGGAQFDGMLVLQVDAIDISSGDERYQIIIQGSNSPTFASGIENLATLDLGATGARAGGAKSSGLGQHHVGVVNEAEDTIYRYLRLFNAVSGTTPSISYRAWLSNPAGH